MILLAQASNGGPGIWQVIEHIVAISSVVGVIIMWLTYRRKSERVKIEPPLPRQEVEGELEVRAKGRRFNAAEWDARYSDLSGRIKDLDSWTKTEVDRIYDRIDDVNKRAEDNLKEAIKNINETIRRLPGEIVELLKHTGQLKEHHD